MTFRNALTRWSKAVIFLAAIVLAGRVFVAGEAAAEKAAIAHYDWGSITFEVLEDVGRVTLIVAGDENYRTEQVFEAGAVPWIDAASLADGYYRYELRLLRALSDEEQEVLAAAEEAGDEEALEALQPLVLRHSGNFSIDGGTLINPDEERALE